MSTNGVVDKTSSPTAEGERDDATNRARPSRLAWIGLGILAPAILIVVAVLATADRQSPQSVSAPAPPSAAARVATQTATPAVVMMPRSWILRPTLPATASQADKGAQVYQLVCSTCHGYGGEGLSYGSWVEMASETENCWQAKCHGGAHPPDGFALPREIPPVVGERALARFPNALSLYQFVRATMPLQDPASMLDEEYWEVTAYLVRANGFDSIRSPLDPKRAAEVTFR